MAARRLVIVMLILLGASTLAAALVPVPPPEEQGEQARPEPRRPEPTGELERRSIRVSRGGASTGAEEQDPPTVRIALGDQLRLTVRSPRPDEVEIPALGELRQVDRGTPAVFDLLPFEAGTYLVRLVGADRAIARIVVEARMDEGTNRPERGGEDVSRRRRSADRHRPAV